LVQFSQPLFVLLRHLEQALRNSSSKSSTKMSNDFLSSPWPHVCKNLCSVRIKLSRLYLHHFTITISDGKCAHQNTFPSSDLSSRCPNLRRGLSPSTNPEPANESAGSCSEGSFSMSLENRLQLPCCLNINLANAC
jgi:hypothetical protein